MGDAPDTPEETRFIVFAGARPDREGMGGKAAALAALTRAELPVPAWFVVAPEAFAECLSDPDRAALAAAQDAPEFEAALRGLRLTEALRGEVSAALARIAGDGGRVAVRSSAPEEDEAAHSFAGQLESYVHVAPDEVADRIIDVWRSGFTERVIAYRGEHGLPGAPGPPAVLVQRMVDADEAGVAFGADPVSGRRSVVVVGAVHGLGTALVSGSADADTWHVERDGTISVRAIAPKRDADRFCPEAEDRVRAVPIAGDRGGEPVLDDETVRAVAALARRASDCFGRPQDIEWAREAGLLYLVQSRPITTLGSLPDPDGIAVLWDNSNIVESYSGITTPLTFSFARRAYEEVYRAFCRLMGVPERIIEANDETFRCMLGLIRGRVYYNLLNWYRVVALLPGYRANRRFMEQMMGVREALPAALEAEIGTTSGAERRRDRLRLVRSIAGLLGAGLTLPRRGRRFRARLDDALAEPDPPLARMRADELASSYRYLERRLLTRWDAPIVNDFFAMVFHGLLRKLCAAWCPDGGESLHNDLLCGEGGMISTEPARRLRAMAEHVAGDEAATTCLRRGDVDEMRRTVRERPALAELYDAYLERFGDRCLDELKLESATLHDDPVSLLRGIGHLAHRLETTAGAAPEEGDESVEARMRREAEARARDDLRRRPLHRFVFRWVLGHARRRVRDRENLRFERTRLFGRVRRIFVEIGKRLHAEGHLREPRDVFSLEIEEVLGFIAGTASTTDCAGLADLRRAEFERFAGMDAPDERFQTRGMVHQGNDFRGTDPAAPDDEETGGSEDERRGLACCPGIVRAPVRVIIDPRGASLGSGEILVARRTDPGWVMLFPAAAGILVERGSLLSHSAIVAREMGIPAIVSIPGVATWLRDGDEVEMDGATGRVRGSAPSMGTRSMKAEAARHADFSQIRYAQCWEDADVLVEGLDVQPGDTCLSIASAGDNALALLTRRPAQVIAIDLSPAQLACLELRVSAYRALEHAELLELIGSRASERRRTLYERCRRGLSDDARWFWDAQPEAIEGGIGAAGRFERYFARFRGLALPLVHSRRRVEALLRGGTREERHAFYAQRWNTRRWRLLFRVFFSRFVMGRLGRDPSFFRYVEGSVADRILERTRHALTELDPAENPYLHWILTGRHGTALPRALRPEHFETIRDHLDRVQWRLCSLEAFLDDTATPVDRANLSDVFEYMGPDRYAALLARITEVMRPGGRLAYWNMLAPRSRPPALADRLEPLEEIASALHARDRAFFYSAFVVEEVR